MRRLISHLRLGFFALTIAGALGFGATQAFADVNADTPWYTYCPATGYDYPNITCAYGCDSTGRGYCTADGRCACGDLP